MVSRGPSRTVDIQVTNLKQLRSTTAELRQLFEKNITVRAVAEFDLWKADAAADGEVVREEMAAKDFDVAPVVDGTTIIGYVARDSLTPGPCGDQSQPITAAELIAESAPLLDLFAILRVDSWRFVLDRDEVAGIVARGDLRKAPARMYIFALINLLEMQMDRIIRAHYGDEDWRIHLRPTRIEKALKLFELRQQANEALHLLDCLQFCDKRDLVVRVPGIVEQLGFSDSNNALRVFRDIEALRNRIAHAQDMVEGITWTDLFNLSETMHRILRRCEAIASAPTSG